MLDISVRLQAVYKRPDGTTHNGFGGAGYFIRPPNRYSFIAWAAQQVQLLSSGNSSDAAANASSLAAGCRLSAVD